MHVLEVRIERFVDEHCPGWVECSLLDALGEKHAFEEKVPIVTAADLGPGSSYPQPGFVACEVEGEWRDSGGRCLMRVTTERPWGVESVRGVSTFVVAASQVGEQRAA